MQVSALDPNLSIETPTEAPDSRESRRESLVERYSRLESDCDAMLVCDATDIEYLTGVGEGISWLLVFRNSTVAIVRHMLIHEVKERIPECELLLPSVNSTDRPDVETFVVSELKRRSVRNVLIETPKISADCYLRLVACCAENGVSLHPTSRIVSGLRAVKKEEELRAIRACVAIAESSIRELISNGAAGFIGRIEREIAVELERIMIAFGADRQGFPGTGIIVASGSNGSSAHHPPGSRVIKAGDPVLIDWGAELNGYRSDLTRTFFMRSVPDFAISAYPVVEEALNSSAAKLQPGELLGTMDKVARETIVAAGYPEFHYGVGHGLGLEIHEEPWIRAGSEELLEEGMVTTIEPGIYLPGVGGIRIENLFRIVPGGAENLASLPTSLDDMVLS